MAYFTCTLSFFHSFFKKNSQNLPNEIKQENFITVSQFNWHVMNIYLACTSYSCHAVNTNFQYIACDLTYKMKYTSFFLKISLTEKFKALEALVIISYCKPFFFQWYYSGYTTDLFLLVINFWNQAYVDNL